MTDPEDDDLTADAVRRSLRDLMGLLALPALWVDRDADVVVDLVMQAVERIAGIDACFVDVPSADGKSQIVRLRVHTRDVPEAQREEWAAALDTWRRLPLGGAPMRSATPLGEMRVLRMSIGYSASEGSVWFASAARGFPQTSQLAFLRAAASLGATGLRSARVKHEREQASRAKDEFLAMLGHELRNPLAPIKTALALIRREHHDAALGQYFQMIERQVTQLSRLVEDLLDVSRITRGKLELKSENVRIGSVLARAVEAVASLVEQRRQKLTLDIADDGAILSGDVGRLTQVFSNLLTNAAKYSEVGGRIAVEGRASETEVSVVVTDNGVGIGPDLMPRIFTIFEQGSVTVERSRGGLGIGLALVKNLVELHGGSVCAHSDGAGRGARFTVTLPRVTAAGATEHAPPPRQADHGGGLCGLRVLVVDDNADALIAMEAFLTDVGCVVASALDPAEALTVAEDFEPACAILDIGLPGLDGYQLAQALLAKFGARQRALPRLFALTGYGQPADRERSLRCGFERHFVKPVDLGELLDALALPGAPAPD